MKRLNLLVFNALFAAILFVVQVILAPLPNIELVTYLVVVASLSLPLASAMMIVSVFTIIEGLYWGFAEWTIAYFYIWPILVLLTRLLKNRLKEPLFAAAFVGIFGLLFGAMTSLVTLLTLGTNAMIAYILNGLMFDAVHGFSNFMIMLFLHPYISKLSLMISKWGGTKYETQHR
jgi:energy-coupling factor transport system substrate-specific component